jgi:5'(3')-deoxyribonucleotidase
MENSLEGKRYNEGKIRMDLLEPYAIEELAKVFTKGSLKYSDNNWLGGMKWSKMLASLKRHISAFEKGEDFDFNSSCEDCKSGTCTNHTGLYHMAHAAWNCMALVSYYKYFPQGDDRLHNIIKPKCYALDLDDVCASWITEWAKLHNIPQPTSWAFDRAIKDKFDTMQYDGSLEEFYLNLPVLTKPEDIPFEPVVYVTSRPIPSEISEKWLDMHGFPAAPVETVGIENSKVDVLKKYNVDIMVDDNYNNFIEINRAGICCYLFDALHNRRYNVGTRRIKSLKELV